MQTALPVVPMPEITYIADVMLGKLSKWLRILGLDTEYSPAMVVDELIRRALQENRHILTRTTRLCKRADIKDRICFISSDHPMDQVREVIQHYNLRPHSSSSLSRCVICNKELLATRSPVDLRNLPDYVLNTKNIFFICPCCRRIYWRGTHYHTMQELLRKKVFTG